ncbi:uncharacterized protein LOC135845406 isoform X6 [Planococcus citri]|uniref:uncharacterized protein LOC135845406 isoform X6 n=1 Tax=Planococcus citri TaxID=170843 RepID=UPI0031F9F929
MMATNDSRLIFYSSPGQLQELACVVASASIWYRTMEQCRRESTNSCRWLVCDDRQITEIVQLPGNIQKMMVECIKIVQRCFAVWCEFHSSSVFSYPENAGFVDGLVGLISWRADGTIHWEHTAKNLIRSDVLSEIEKYKMACIYCLIDDIRILRLTAMVSDHPMIQYWNFKMSGGECTIQVDEACSCVEVHLLKNCCAETWSAFEYLWGFLTDDEQVEKVIDMNNYTKDYEFLKHALCKLSRTQLDSVISRSSEIFRCLTTEFGTDVIDVWNRLKNVVTNNAFYPILRTLLLHLQSRAIRLTSEIWMDAQDDLKNHLLANYSKKLLNDLRYVAPGRTIEGLSKDVRLLIELLSVMDAESREKFWRENWKDLIVGMSAANLQNIMTLCLGSKDKITSFKKNHLSDYASIEVYCLKLVHAECFEELSEFLQFCSDEPEVVFNLKVSVLKSFDTFDACVIFYGQYPVNPRKFIDETFPDTNQLREFERDLILGQESEPHFKFAIEHGVIACIRNYVELILSSTSDLALAKNRLLELSRDILISGEYRNVRVDAWNDFIKWCLNEDENAVENFKLSLPLDRIFKTLFEICVVEVMGWLYDRGKKFTGSWKDFHPEFVRLEFFLQWVFSSEKAIQDFKLAKLYELRDSGQIKTKFKFDDEMNLFLSWFFNDDKSRIEEFKASLS